MAIAPEIRKKPLNLIKRQSRKLSSVQAYTRIFYKKKKPAIIAKWKHYIAKNPAMKTKPGEYLRFRNLLLKQYFDLETDEVKVEVERRRQEGIFSEDEDIEPDDDDDVDATERQRRTKAFGYQRKVLLHI